MFRIFVVAFACFMIACAAQIASAEDQLKGAPKTEFVEKTIRPAYLQLLTQFDEKDQGHSLDHFKKFTGSQPMTYGMVLSAEAIRYRKMPTDEGARRVKQATRWIIDNQDLDKDGQPGWGLPQPWDTFADGTENPPNTPYTITTAIVVEGLLDALLIEKLWTPAERDEIFKLVKNVELHWCNDLWMEGFGGGFFRYSIHKYDDVFTVNAPAMFLGTMVRFLKEQGKSLSEADRSLIEKRAHDFAKAVIGTVMLREGLPFWYYSAAPNRLKTRSPNDLLHQGYILWGIEAYRDFAPDVKFPWTREQAVKSMDTFWRDDVLHEFSTTDLEGSKIRIKTPPRLWCTGMAVAVYAKYGTAEQTERAVKEMLRQHGPLPRLRFNSADKSEKGVYYGRHASHALFGLAHAGYVK